MAKRFNVNGSCDPNRHYMVNLDSRLKEIRQMVDFGDYFTINKARQYGKTTILRALTQYLKSDYEVVSLDFQTLSAGAFENEKTFVSSFAKELLDNVTCFPSGVKEELEKLGNKAEAYTLQDLFLVLKMWCRNAERKIVLLIDEVDTATNNQVFLDFLAQLRAYYLKRPEVTTFQSVILAGVCDVRSIKRKIRADEDHKANSPWITRADNEENASLLAFDDCPRDQMELAPFDIAADFDIDMSFQAKEIANMLNQYEDDYHTGMDVSEIS